MKVISRLDEMSKHAQSARRAGKKIGFVPTMGFLHPGHLSLAGLCRKENCDKIVMSIFVNPLQFGPSEDFQKYPRDLERDQSMAKGAGIDVLFVPETSGMYPPDAKTYVEVGEMGKVMCGVSRPDHFRGVTTVVAKLFNIINPDVAVFGQKDAQQFLILRRMVTDLNMPVKLVMAPIVREPDGLAMSSRNVYLSGEERKQALSLSQSLKIAQELIKGGEKSSARIICAMKDHIGSHPLAQFDYVTIVETEGLRPLDEIRSPALIALAVYIGKTRLIDNCII